MFNCKEIVEAVYKGGSLPKNTQQAESDRSSFGRYQKGGGDAASSNPNKCCAGKCKKNDAGHTSNAPTGAKKTYMLHGPRHSSEECKVLKGYSKKQVVQQPFKDK